MTPAWRWPQWDGVQLAAAPVPTPCPALPRAAGHSTPQEEQWLCQPWHRERPPWPRLCLAGASLPSLASHMEEGRDPRNIQHPQEGGAGLAPGLWGHHASRSAQGTRPAHCPGQDTPSRGTHPSGVTPPCQPPCPSSAGSREVTAALCPRPCPGSPAPGIAQSSLIPACRGSGSPCAPVPPPGTALPSRKGWAVPEAPGTLLPAGRSRARSPRGLARAGTGTAPRSPVRGRTLCVSSASRLGAGLPASRVPLDGIVGHGGGHAAS